MNSLAKAYINKKNYEMKLKLLDGLVYIKETSAMKKFILTGGIP
jgi:hypothetical protein